MSRYASLMIPRQGLRRLWQHPLRALRRRLGRWWCSRWHRGPAWKRLATGANSALWHCRRCGRAHVLPRE